MNRVECLRRALVGLAVACMTVPALAFDLDALMTLLAARKSGNATFTEERTVASLEQPLRFSGRLSFTAPDSFTRITEQPVSESMAVQGDTVTWKRGERTRRTTLDASPEAAAMVDAMRGTLSGDADALRRHFRVAVSGDAARWLLTLVPASEPIARQVRRVELAGSGADVRSVEVQRTNGDRSLMLIAPAPAPASR